MDNIESEGNGVEVGPSCRQLVEAALDTGWGWGCQTPEEPR